MRKSRPICRLFATAWLFALPVAAQAEGRIRITNGEWLPWVSQTLPHYGPASQVVTEAFAAVGWTVEYGFFPWQRAFELAKNGEYEGTFGWSQIPEREAHFLFSSPVFSGSDVFFFRRDFGFEWDGNLEYLSGKKIGRTLSYSYGQEFDRFARPPTAQIDLAPTDVLNMTKVLNGRIELFPLDWLVGVGLLAKDFSADDAAQIACHPTPLRVAEYRLLLSKKSEKAAETMRQFNQGLDLLRQRGRLDEILADVGVPELPDGRPLPCRPVRVK